MIKSKGEILKEMAENEAIIQMYKEAFPENPAFAAGGKKKKPK